MKNKISTILIITATIILAGIAVFTAIRLYQLRQTAVAPTAPESEPEAVQQSECDVDVMLVLDKSGSMGSMGSPQNTPPSEYKIAKAKRAAIAFVEKMQSAKQEIEANNIRIGVVSFGECGTDTGCIKADLEIGLTALVKDQNPTTITQAINNITVDNDGRTCITCGLQIANDHYRENLPGLGTPQIVILLSDGRGNKEWEGTNCDTEECRAQSTAEAEIGKNIGLEYYVIGYKDKDNFFDEPTLKEIASSPGLPYYLGIKEPDEWLETFVTLATNVCKEEVESTPQVTTNNCPTLNLSLSTPTSTEIATPTPTATPNSCNGTCGSNTNCQSDLSCYNGHCRNPDCPTETDCVCPTATSTPGPTGTAAPTRTPTPTPEPTLPQAGISTPTLLSIGAGFLLLIVSIVLAL